MIRRLEDKVDKNNRYYKALVELREYAEEYMMCGIEVSSGYIASDVDKVLGE